jgi:hypothetical protein
MTVVPSPPDPVELAERVAAAVAAHPAVAGLHGGIYGSATTYLPGRKLIGVRIGEGDEPVEVAVVLRTERPIPESVRSLRSEVSRLCGGAVVDITVADILLSDDVVPDATAVPGEPP